MSQKALNIWTVDFISLERTEYTQRSNLLQQALINRLPISKIAELGYIDKKYISDIMDNETNEANEANDTNEVNEAPNEANEEENKAPNQVNEEANEAQNKVNEEPNEVSEAQNEENETNEAQNESKQADDTNENKNDINDTNNTSNTNDENNNANNDENKSAAEKQDNTDDNDNDNDDNNINSEISVGHYVELVDGIKGIIKYIGATDFAKGQLVGLEMFKSDGEGLDGSKNEKTYFECKQGFGHWTRTEKIKYHSQNIPPQTEPQTDTKESDETDNNNNNNNLLSPVPDNDSNMTYYERFSSVSDWAVPKEIMEEAKRLDEEEEQATDHHDLIDESMHDNNKEVVVNIGDRIITVSGYTGIVRFKGGVHFDTAADRDVLGIELDQWIATGHNGIIDGHTYFTCIEGRGYFVLKQGIESNLGATIKKRRKSSILMTATLLPKEALSDLQADEQKNEIANIKRQMAKIEKKLTDIEVLEIKIQQGEKLNSAQMTKIDRKKHLKEKLGTLTKEMMLINEQLTPNAPKAPMPQINFNVGDRVKLERGKTGIVKFIGETEFAKGEVIGLELDTWTPAGHNGTVRGRIYFKAQEGRGYFTRRSNILNVVLPLVKPINQGRVSIKYKLNPITMNDTIRIISVDRLNNAHLCGKTGTVRYIGYPDFADGEVIGIELDDWCVNAHNGTAHGDAIFDVSPGRGFFTRRDELEKYDPDREKLEEIKKNLKLGDTVILTNNRKGHVKYIGPVTGYDEMIGVELESWSPEAKDGRYDGFRYFTAPDGRGIFIKRNAIIDVIPLEAIQQTDNEDNDSKYDDDMDGDNQMNDSYANITPSIGNRVKLTKGRFGIIHSVDEMDDGSLEYAINISQLIDRTLLSKPVDIAHKRQHSSAGGGRMTFGKKNKSNYVKSTRQSGLLDIEDMKGGKQLMSGTVDDDSDNYDSDDDNYTALGETIELRSGKIGTIRFIGPVHFAKGNWIGVELHDHFGPHDGAVRGVRYFTCPAKRGIFVKQIKGRKKDDPTRQHLKRRCPECYGEFIKKRDPRAAYKTVGIVCDGCSKHGNEFSSNDWYFQCGQCEQTDFCLKCMLKLPIVDSDDMLDSYQNIRAKYKSVGIEWIYEDIHNDSDSDNELAEHKMNNNDNIVNNIKRNSMFQHAPIKTIFDHFDSDSDGKLNAKDINDLYKASRNELDKSLFNQDNIPMKYDKFEQCWKEITPNAAQHILEFISAYAKPKHHANTIEILEKVRDVFDFFDSDMDGVLNGKDVEHMMLLIDINWDENLTETKLLFETPCDYVKFVSKIQSTPAVIINNILEQLLCYIHLKIEDIFNTFVGRTSSHSDVMKEDNMIQMYVESCATESAWRGKFVVPCNLESFIASWFSIEIDERHCILNETNRRINRRLMSVFNHFDWDDKGTLTNEQIKEILQLIDIANDENKAKAKTNKLFENTPLSFQTFKKGINSLQTSITRNILPNLEQYIIEQNPPENEEEKQPIIVEQKVDNNNNNKKKKNKVAAVVEEKTTDISQLPYRQQWHIRKGDVGKLINELQNTKEKAPISEKCITNFNDLVHFFDDVIVMVPDANDGDGDSQTTQQEKELATLRKQNAELMNAVKVLQNQLSKNKERENENYAEHTKELQEQTQRIEIQKQRVRTTKRLLLTAEEVAIEREEELKQEEQKISLLTKQLENAIANNQANQAANHNQKQQNEMEMEKKERADMDELERQMNIKNNQLNDLNQMNVQYQQELKGKEVEIIKYKTDMEQQSKQTIAKNNEIAQYTQKEQRLNAEIGTLQQKNESLQNNVSELKQNESELMERITDLTNSKYRLINSTAAEIDDLRHRIKMYTDRNWNALISPVPK